MVTVPPPPPKEHRGGGFRGLLILLSVASAVGSVGGLISVAMGSVDDNGLGPSPLPRRVLMLSLCGLINVGCMAGVWGWRRWGVYGVVCVSLFAFILNWRIAGPMIAGAGLIGPVLLAVVAGLSWAEFD